MFSYLRVFAIISMLLIVGATTLAGATFKNLAMDDLTRMTEKTNSSIVQGYIEAVWSKYRETINGLAISTPEQVRSNPEVLRFAQDTLRYFKKMPFMRINIYNSSGSLLLSSDITPGVTLAGRDPSPDSNFILNQLRGTSVSSHTLENIPLKNGEMGLILQTLIPISVMTPDSPSPVSEGAVEVLYDLSSPLEKFSNARLVGTSGILGIFIVFLLLLFGMSRRAEAIITKQHEANIELAAAAAAAQAENQDKSQFLANISHELRTPLNSIIGFSEILKNTSTDELDSQRSQEYINDINSAGVHLLSLINDILDYSKAEAGKLELEVSEVNANKLVQNCIRLVMPRAETAQVALVEALPKEALNMVVDSKKFKQIMLNLLSNAVKFTPAGGEVRISAWADITNDMYVFQVRDSGIGIAAKDISRAMAPFGQVDSTLSRKYDGTGLGLPLTKKFVELMGGKFEIESEVGVGTTIRFSLPREITEREGVVIKRSE